MTGSQRPFPEAGTDRESLPANAAEKRWGAMSHLSGFAFLLLPPIDGILAALAIWSTIGRKSAYVEMQAREALNFQIFILLAVVLRIALMYILIGVFVLIGVALLDLGCMIRGTLKAHRGILHIYPYSLRLVKARQ